MYSYVRAGEPADLAGRWEVPLSDGVHVVEFEHGTVTGRRLVRVDGQVLELVLLTLLLHLLLHLRFHIRFQLHLLRASDSTRIRSFLTLFFIVCIHVFSCYAIVLVASPFLCNKHTFGIGMT